MADKFGERHLASKVEASEGPMWLMGTPGSLIFIVLVAVMVGLSLVLLA